MNAGYLETAPFDAKAFTNEMITSFHFEMSAQQPLAALSEPAFHELYRDIALIQKWAAKKDGKELRLYSLNHNKNPVFFKTLHRVSLFPNCDSTIK